MKKNPGDQYYFNRKTESFFPFQFVFVGYLLTLLGIYLLYTLNFLGLLAIAGGLFFSFSSTGVEIRFSDNKFREYFGILNFKFGEWRKLPKIEYVTMYVDRSIQQMNVASISTVQANSDVKINLVVTKTELITIGAFKNKIEAMETGKHLAGKLNTRLLDYTSGKQVWLHVLS